MPRALNNAGEYMAFFSLELFCFQAYKRLGTVCGNATAERVWLLFII